MLRTVHHLALAAALALAVAPGAAFARFGKAGSASSSSSHSSSSPGSGNGAHAATPAGGSRPGVVAANPCAVAPDYRCWRYAGWPAYFWEPTYLYGPPAYVPVAGPGPQGVEASRGLPIRTEVTGEVMGITNQAGGSGAAQLRVEGVKWGVALDGRYLGVSANDGTGAVDHLAFLDGFVTYALFGNERGRFRLELGGNTAFAPDLIVMSPAAGASFAMALGDQFGLEALARASVFPHTQVEVAAGVSYALGPVGFRAGWRHLYLNDNGLVDGVPHPDAFSGPYLGAGMAF